MEFDKNYMLYEILIVHWCQVNKQWISSTPQTESGDLIGIRVN